jgi:hypothetical protein
MTVEKMTGKGIVTLNGATGCGYIWDEPLTQEGLDDFASNIAGEIEDKIKGQDFIDVKTTSWDQLSLRITINVEVGNF